MCLRGARERIPVSPLPLALCRHWVSYGQATSPLTHTTTPCAAMPLPAAAPTAPDALAERDDACRGVRK